MELYFDIDLCINCKSCEIACARENGRKILRLEVFDAQFPLLEVCRHCEKNPCIEACPTDAIYKKGSVIYVREALCIGCKSCLFACPFGNLSFEATRHSTIKCDLCMGKLEKGEKPVCAITCPTGAIRYCERQEMEEVGKRARRARRMIGARLYAWRPT